MVYLIIMLFILATIILIRNYANKFSLGFSLMILGLIMSLLGTVLFISSIGNYPSPDIRFFSLDYKLYTLLTNLNLGYYNTINLINLGTSIYLFAMPITVCLWTIPLYYIRNRNLFTILILWVIYSVYHFWYYNPTTLYNAYIILMDSTYPAWAKFLCNLFTKLSMINRVIIFSILVASIIWLIVFYFRTHTKLKKQESLSMIFCISFLNFFWVVFFINGFAGKTIDTAYDLIDMLYFNIYSEMPINMYIVYTIIMFFGTILMLGLVIKNKAFDTIDFFTEHNIKRNMNSTNNDIRNIFHTIKNNLFSIQILANNGSTSTQDAVAKQTFKRISEISNNSLFRVEHMLTSLKNVNISTETIDFIEILENAIARSTIDPSIEIVRDYKVEKVITIIDTYHISEALINVFNNASEAIILAKRDDGIIQIELYIDYDWLVLNIKDNGTGIPTKDLKRIFKPFYSTKAPDKSWGVGLTYSYNVIKAHSGFLIARSQEDVYTNMQCLIPVKRGGVLYE